MSIRLAVVCDRCHRAGLTATTPGARYNLGRELRRALPEWKTYRTTNGFVFDLCQDCQDAAPAYWNCITPDELTDAEIDQTRAEV